MEVVEISIMYIETITIIPFPLDLTLSIGLKKQTLLFS